MAITSHCTVRISKPATVSFAEAMSQYRVWLDAKKIQPAMFKPDYFHGVIGFEIGFHNEHEAELFDREFG